MLSKILILSFFIFSVIYPLCFWISYKDPLKNNFHKFHIGLPNVIAGTTLATLFFMHLPLWLLIVCIIWKASLLTVSNYSWKKPFPSPKLMTIPCVIGLYAFSQLHIYFLGPGLDKIFVSVVGGVILSASLFAMNLGHWYLNVHGLPIKHLQRSGYVLGIFLAIRCVWDLGQLISAKIFYDGEVISLVQFIGKMDGFLLLIALFFGTVFPFVSLYFVEGTLKVKNTQSATGILYVILTSILLGDMTYKYYLLKFGIAL